MSADIDTTQPRPATLTAHYRETMRQFPTAVTVLTTAAPDGPHGMTASSLTSVSLDPPTLLISLQRGSRTRDLLELDAHFTINLLAETQADIAMRFARKPGHGAFAGAAWQISETTGAAVLETATAHIDCRVSERVEAADHTLVLAEVMAAATHAGRAGPLVHYNHDFRGVTG